MKDLICPYSATLAQKRDFFCVQADEVIRRGGAEYICLTQSQHTVCCDIHQRVKKEFLDDQGLEDDLLLLPHSMLVKIQFGCLLGLQSALGDDSDGVSDIEELITHVTHEYDDMESLPYESINLKILKVRLQKRGRKNK